MATTKKMEWKKRKFIASFRSVCVFVFFVGPLKKWSCTQTIKMETSKRKYILFAAKAYTQEAQYAYTLSECECECDHRASGCLESVGLVRVNGFFE